MFHSININSIIIVLLWVCSDTNKINLPDQTNTIPTDKKKH